MVHSVKFKSLAAATAVGAGASMQYVEALVHHDIQVIITGAPTAVRVDVESSNDGGTTWGAIDTWSLAGGDVSGGHSFTSGQPVMMMRANLVTLTAGTTPTVTAYIVSAQ